MNLDENATTLIQKITELFTAGLMSTFGGVAAYIYQNVKADKPFAFKSFLISAFLSFFAGNLVGAWVPHSFEYRDGILMLAGFSAWPLLGLVELKGKDWIAKWIESKIASAAPAPQIVYVRVDDQPSLPPPVGVTTPLTDMPPSPMTKDEN